MATELGDNCYQYCNISTPTFEESETYKCMSKQEGNNTLTGWWCRNATKGKKSDACARSVDKFVLGAVVVAISGWILGYGGV